MKAQDHITIAATAASVQDALVDLKAASASPVESIHALSKGRGISLRAAKAAFGASAVWFSEVAVADQMHEEIIQSLGGASIETEGLSDFYCDEAISGATPVEVVYENSTVLAFYHTKPFWPVHIVVVPKQHVPSLTDLGYESIDTLHAVIEVVRKVAKDITGQYGSCRVLTNLGDYQDSKHLHFHVAHGEEFGENRPR